MDDIIDTILEAKEFEKQRKCLEYADDGLNNNKYLLYTPSYPWKMDNNERELSKEHIETMIVEVVQSFSNLNKESILRRVYDISIGDIG